MKYIEMFENFNEEVDYIKKVKELVNTNPEMIDLKIAGDVSIIDGMVEGYVKYLSMKDGELSIVYDIDIDDSGVPSEEEMTLNQLTENDAKSLYEYIENAMGK